MSSFGIFGFHWAGLPMLPVVYYCRGGGVEGDYLPRKSNAQLLNLRNITNITNVTQPNQMRSDVRVSHGLQPLPVQHYVSVRGRAGFASLVLLTHTTNFSEQPKSSSFPHHPCYFSLTTPRSSALSALRQVAHPASLRCCLCRLRSQPAPVKTHPVDNDPLLWNLGRTPPH